MAGEVIGTLVCLPLIIILLGLGAVAVVAIIGIIKAMIDYME